MMKVLIDHQIFSYQRFGGISRYFYELAEEFTHSKTISFDLGITFSDNQYLKNARFLKLRNLWFPTSEQYKIIRLGFLYSLNRYNCIKKLRKQDFDIYHASFYDPFFLKYLGSKPFVVTIHDMTPERFPELFPKDSLYARMVTSRWIEMKKLLSQKATAIFTVSENTKKDLVELFNIDPNKVTVTYLGNSLRLDPANTKVCPGFPSRYILFVGSRNSYKNFVSFIKAVKPLLLDDKSLHVVCVGGGEFTVIEKNLQDFIMVKEQIHQFSLSDDMLASAYKNALIFVYPSFIEGFGIPILESFACECPAAISNTSCFPEIASDAAQYFDPYNADSITDAIKHIVYDPLLRDELRAKGKERVKHFTWERTARQTAEIYSAIRH